MIVFRIESKDTRMGPFGGRLPGLEGLHSPYRMPEPQDDIRIKIVGTCQPKYWEGRYAYPNLRTLLRWWNDEAILLAASNGFVLSVYRVSEYTLYANQVYYCEHNATILREAPLTVLSPSIRSEAIRLSNVVINNSQRII